ncbi:MAG TPA: hypothetical protein VNC22_10445 [Sporichthya sp.]|jgi:hypothetical protein|nr:hypothetical protein [Sporichthya sp.]
MRSTTKALAVVGSLLAGGLWTAPAQAAATGPVVIKNCATTAHGVPLRVKLRFEMRSASDPNDVRLMRVRVTHPDGTGNFASDQVRSVATTLVFETESVNPQIGGAAFAERRGDHAVYRKRLNAGMASATAVVRFTLANGRHAAIGCRQQFPPA